MRASIPGPALPRQSSSPTDCRHSRTGFHTLFHPIAARRDITPVAKLVHQALVSMHRMGAAWTQTEIGEAVGLSRHQVWRAIDELVAAGWLNVRRVGLGRPNEYELVGIDADDLNGRASGRRPAAQPYAGPSGVPARVPTYPKNKLKNSGYQPPAAAKDLLMTSRGYSLSRLNR